MAKTYYMPKDDNGKMALLDLLATRLPIYADTLEIREADIASLQADAAAFRYMINAYNVIQGNARLWTSFKNLQRDGGSGSGAFPAAANLPASVPSVLPGIIPRVTALIARIKTARNYTEAIGQDLSIVGSTQVIDPAYTDASPTPGTSGLWKYKAIYRLRDEQVGSWSDVISVAIGG